MEDFNKVPNCPEQPEPNYYQEDVQPHPTYPAQGEKQSVKYHLNDDGSALWGVFGFLMPIPSIGVYLFIKDTWHKNAKSLKTGIIIAIVMCIILFIMAMFLGVLAAMITDHYSMITDHYHEPMPYYLNNMLDGLTGNGVAENVKTLFNL